MPKKILFLLSLLPSLCLGEPLDRVIAIVNDNVITASELKEQTDTMRNQLAAKRMQIPPEEVLRKQVLQHLIDVDIQLQMAKNGDIRVEGTELDDTIQKIADQNHISLTRLREELAKQGISWDTYRANLRKEILISRLQQKAVGQEIVVTSQQVEDYLKTSAQTIKTTQSYHLQNIVIPLPEEPTSEQLKKAQEKIAILLSKIKAGADFSQLAIQESSGEYALEGGDLGERHLAELPEVFAKKVVTMQVNEVAGPIRTGNGYQLIKLIAVAGNDDHHQVSKTHVRHILLKQDMHMTEADALKQVNNIYQQLHSGKDFAMMAKQYSLDSASAVKGGDLGWVTEDELVPQFAKAMASLPLHTVSQPVKSPFGWHLIEVLERKTVDDSAAYQRQQVRQYLQQRKFTEAVQNWLQHMRAEAYVKIMDKELA